MTNLWASRMLGDQALPEGESYTRSNMTLQPAFDAPLPSGLLGPVRILGMEP